MNIRHTLIYLAAAISISLTSIPGNGQTLYREKSGTDQTLHAVFFPLDADYNTDSLGVAVGDSGTLSLTPDSGYTWNAEQEPFTGNFYCEYFNDSANGSFAGDDGTIFTELEGKTPIKITLPESNPIYAMTFPSYDTGIVTGANGLFYRTIDSGKTWNKIALPAAAQKFNYYGTDYFDDDTYWIVGQDGLALYTEDDGTTWQRYPVPTVGTASTKTLYSIYFPSDGSATGWIVGDQCLFYTTDGGDDWESISTTDSLRCVAGWDSTDAYAVGLHGAIFYTSDRTDWSPYPSGTTANLYGFDFPDSLFFVGDSGLILTTMPPKVVEPPQPNFEVIGPYSKNTVSFGSVGDWTDSTNSNAMIENLTSIPDTIVRISSDSSEFIIDNVAGNQTPFVVDSGSPHPIQITFKPPVPIGSSSYQSTLRVFSSDNIERDATLTAEVIPLGGGGVSVASNPAPLNILLTSGQRSDFVSCPNNWIAPIHLEVFNLLGTSIFFTDNVITDGANVMPAQLPSGVYFYRLSSGSGSCFGKFVFY